MTPDVQMMEQAVRAARDRAAFVLAKVVWRQGPTSGPLGGAAIVWPDGSIEGFVGGACAQPSVISEALESLQDGEPRLLFLGEFDDEEATPAPGVRVIPMACESEGALQMYLEPHLPPPAIVAVGDTPAVEALITMAQAIGWDARAVASPDLGLPAPDPSTAVVVASQGQYDDLALRAALATDAGYIGLVGSKKRCAATIELLDDPGGGDRIIGPAGLDLGSTTHTEIAVAILADLVARRARGDLQRIVTAPRVRTEATDPVCGMTVVVEEAHHRHDHDGRTYVFCAAGCRAAFSADPSAFAPTG
ncbi:XdhC family protein [Euzebya tangerina]|uniref:XdhC family protein n=1 Tax=Euzebya tangerina TaxID=591198 RepID=UPI000E3118A3|nr:XdhC family protein [Euzebya tangerina]